MSFRRDFRIHSVKTAGLPFEQLIMRHVGGFAVRFSLCWRLWRWMDIGKFHDLRQNSKQPSQNLQFSESRTGSASEALKVPKICMHAYIHTYTSTSTSTSTYTYTYTYHIHIYIYAHIYIYTYTYTYTHIHIYTYIYIGKGTT